MTSQTSYLPELATIAHQMEQLTESLVGNLQRMDALNSRMNAGMERMDAGMEGITRRLDAEIAAVEEAERH